MRKQWQDIKSQVLGKKYDLSAVFIDNSLMAELNLKYRNKSYPANVLSFALSKDEGEILINANFKADKNYSDYLFLHSALHLKGLKHGKKMSDEEKKFIKKFKLKIDI